MFRLKELRLGAGLTRAALSRQLGINQGTLANYENEIRQADYLTLRRLADYFEVSIDYLLGIGSEFDGFKAPPKSELEFMEKNLIFKYRSLSKESKELVFLIIDHLVICEKN